MTGSADPLKKRVTIVTEKGHFSIMYRVKRTHQVESEADTSSYSSEQRLNRMDQDLYCRNINDIRETHINQSRSANNILKLVYEGTSYTNRFVTIQVNQKTMRMQVDSEANVKVITNKECDQIGQ